MGDADIAHKEPPRGKTGIMRMRKTFPHGGADGAPAILLVLLPSQLGSTGVGRTKALSNSISGDSRSPFTHPLPMGCKSQPRIQSRNNPDCGTGTGFGGQTSKSCSLAWLAAKKISS